jgi:hypothetical protein
MMSAQDMSDQTTSQIALAHIIAIHALRIQYGSLQETALLTLSKLLRLNIEMLMNFHMKISKVFLKL